MKLLACQILVPPMTERREAEAHLARLDRAIRARLEVSEVDLVVLPELSSIDYAAVTFERLEVMAEELQGRSFEVFSRIAETFGVFICYGIARRDGADRHISQVVVGPDGGYVGHYDKLHIAQFGASAERPHFVSGDQLLVFDVAGIRAAPIICYDIRFPELTRRLCTTEGVELILHSTAFFADESYYSWRSFAISRAMENQVYFLSLNRAGPNWGSSLLCPPWVDGANPEIVFGKEECLEVCEVDRDRIKAARAGYPLLRDRRRDYGTLPASGGSRSARQRAAKGLYGD